ncbi:TetR/AcrR family transcriptional regulator [Sulfurimonas sp.]|uniref:TetR/AcrR family transcriptional regulator n=1 Tax=Sulfurimonas sp. TaxID=2022749 RepID=UPI0025CD0EEE|nr:TetR/AcrR family transcriptional regulator [Sulfurimonas sp.]MDD5157626.1 TetR/AcrR family transcriptional regulator [Sulfurimonas sp.]
MAIIVDKVQKKRDIALSCRDIFFENGIRNLTISQIAKTAGIGKGTIYDYFRNKDDIVFEIVNIMIQERNKTLETLISGTKSTKDKIKLFGSFFYSDEDAQLRGLYKEFISIALSSPDEEMIKFQTECFNLYYLWFEKTIEHAINSGEIIAESKQFCKGLFVFAEGMFISSLATNAIVNVKDEIDSFVDALFKLVEVKK